MLYSMTGYGQHRSSYKEMSFLSEVKTLNSRNTDIRLKVPTAFRELETEMRKMIQEKAVRGKVDYSLTIEGSNSEEHYQINIPQLRQYHTQLKQFTADEGISYEEPLSSLVRLPNAYVADSAELTAELKKIILEGCAQALDKMVHFRATEGEATAKFLERQVKSIEALRQDSVAMDTGRIDKLKARIHKNLEAISTEVDIDQNRLEQEIIYYIEKMDYSEETQRLEQHCAYFLEVLHTDEVAKGRKLNFIAQEMGREINTLGSKANDADVQRVVVNMKDELEKIKEQLANIL